MRLEKQNEKPATLGDLADALLPCPKDQERLKTMAAVLVIVLTLLLFHMLSKGTVHYGRE